MGAPCQTRQAVERGGAGGARGPIRWQPPRRERWTIVNGGYGIGIEHTTVTMEAAKPLNTTHAATHTDSGTVLSSGLPARW